MTDTDPVMKGDQDHIRKTINGFMQRRGLKPKPWAQRAKLGDNTLIRFLKRPGATITQRTLEKLAAAENVAVAILTGEQPDPLNKSKNSSWHSDLDVESSASDLTEADVQNLQLMVRRLGEIKDELSKLNEQQTLTVELLRKLIEQAKSEPNDATADPTRTSSSR